MNRLKELRKAKDVTQSYIAAKFHIYQYRISRMENGLENPTLEEAKKLAKYFNVTIDYLMGIWHPLDELQGITSKEVNIIKTLRNISPEDREYIEGLIESFNLRS